MIMEAQSREGSISGNTNRHELDGAQVAQTCRLVVKEDVTIGEDTTVNICLCVTVD